MGENGLQGFTLWQKRKGILLSGSLLTLSVAAHGAFLAVPIPGVSPKAPTPSAAPLPDDITVAILPEGSLMAEPAREQPTLENLQPSSTALSVQLDTSGLLAAEVAPAPTVAQVSPMPDIEDLAPQPMTAAEETMGQEDTSQNRDVTGEEPTAAAFDPETDAAGKAADAAGPLVAYDAAFPHVTGAEGGCYGLTQCRRVSGVGTYRDVARSLIANLEAQGYQVKLRQDIDDPGRNVYEISSPDTPEVPHYLMVFSDITDGAAIYVMSKEILTLKDLQGLQVGAISDQAVG